VLVHFEFAGEEREQPRNDHDVRRWPAGGPAVELGVGVAVELGD
jgi:hypothetical protein